MIKSNSLWFIPTEHNKKESTFFCVKCCRTVYEWVKRTWLYNTCNKKIFVKLPLFLFFGEENKSQIPRKKLNSILSVAVFFFFYLLLLWMNKFALFWYDLPVCKSFEWSISSTLWLSQINAQAISWYIDKLTRIITERCIIDSYDN